MITSICTIGTFHSVRDVGPVQSEATQKKMLLRSGTGGLTMAECIKRDTAIAVIEEKQKELCPVGRYGRNYVYGSDREKYDAWDEIADALENIPAADVAPVVHSYWEHKITNDGENIGICHNCKYPVSWFWEQAKYCPNCGAKMDGGQCE